MRRTPLEPDRMSLEEMGQAVMTRLADLLAGLPQLSETSNGHQRSTAALLERMLRPPGEEPTELGALLDTFQVAAEHSLDTAGPGYLAYFPAGGLFSSAFAELLAQAYNRYTAVAELAPALVALEHGIMKWLAGLFGLPDTAIGVMTTGGSMATLVAMVAARDHRLGDDIASGTVYVTEHTHFCVAKAARIAGLRTHQLRTVPVSGLRMDPVQARSMITADRARGLRPFLLVGTAGSTSTGTIDPLPELAELSGQEDLWFHVDAAYGGGFQMTARGSKRLAGIECASSIAVDPHKTLFVQYGTGVVLVRDPVALQVAHSGGGDYLQDLGTAAGLPDYGHLGPELTREFRGLRLWLPLHLHGVAAFRAALDEKLDLANIAYQELAADARFEVPGPPDLTVVIFRLRGDDEPNLRLLERINGTGRIFLSSTRVDGRYFLRLNPTSHRTHATHVHEAVSLIRDSADAVQGIAGDAVP